MEYARVFLLVKNYPVLLSFYLGPVALRLEERGRVCDHNSNNKRLSEEVLWSPILEI